ncbi:lysosome membrane protein 2-like [Mya arenaria]|uniref:lysosome membrane protein 2-like n=1 Tax=Mya arenaria TaxID=6604 RepID=UPI0022E82F67|nr:lysosome membrane protein 2-like [Mya arenaria]XP_052815898.1 lysosome membrane protein 2-like [Mya arenaria]XP_052815899.1 lysosome membrane protein 2-like [Mya arenaria]XP_052815900.1 lysosome membrane protein 2-like [Mya arenaria]
MAWSVKKRVAVACAVGWSLTILGACLIPLLEWVIKKQVEKTVVIKEGGPVYEFWLDPPVPIYLQVYMFNLTNPDEVLAGTKPPNLVQAGPYTYSEKRTKYDIKFNDNGTVTYRQNRTFHFLPDMSQGHNESDIFVTANPVYWALYNALVLEEPVVREVIYLLTQVFDEHPFMTRPLREIIWGYHDQLLNITKAIDPDWFYTDYIGFFMNKNATNDGVYTVYTGESDISKLGVIDKYNGSSHLDFWTTTQANMINGSDGTLGPPYLPKDTTTYSFSSDVCRSVPGVYSKDVKSPQGIKLWRFSGPMSAFQNATENPANLGYCTPQTNCLGGGLVNVSACQSVDFFHLPVAVSLPHFLFTDKRYLEAVTGLSPNEEEHNTILDLEPYTGLVLRAEKRVQINVYLTPIANVTETLDIKPVFLPIFWLNESAVIDDKSAAKLKRLLFTPLLIIEVGEITLICVGVLILLGTVIYGIRKNMWDRESQTYSSGETDESTNVEYDTQPILPGNSGGNTEGSGPHDNLGATGGSGGHDNGEQDRGQTNVGDTQP